MFENYDSTKYDLYELIYAKYNDLKQSTDISYKKKMVEAFFDLAKGFEDLIKCFETVCEFFEDRKWALRYIPLVEKVSEHISDNRVIGELYYFLSEDLKKTREYFEKAEDTTDSEELMFLAQSVLDCLEDRDWYIEICSKVQEPNIDFACAMKKNLGNNQIIKDLIFKSVTCFTNNYTYTKDLVLAMDCVKIRNYIRDVAATDDLDLLKKIIIKLEQANVFHESIAEQIACTLDEQEWACEHYINRVKSIPTYYPAGREGLSGSEALTITYHQLYVSLFNSCVKHLSKPESAVKVLDTILPILETSKQFINYNFQLFDAYFHKHFAGIEHFDKFAALAIEKEEVFKIALVGYLLGKSGLEMLQYIQKKGFESDAEVWYCDTYNFIRLHYSEYKVYEFDSEILPYLPLEENSNDFVKWNQSWKRLSFWTWYNEYEKILPEGTLVKEQKEKSQDDILKEQAPSLTKLPENIDSLIESENFKEYMSEMINDLAKSEANLEIGENLLSVFGEQLASANLIDRNFSIKIIQSDQELYKFVEENIPQEELNKHSFDLSEGTVKSFIYGNTISSKLFENNSLYKVSEDLWKYNTIFKNIGWYKTQFVSGQNDHLAKFIFENLKEMAATHSGIEDIHKSNILFMMINQLAIKYLIEKGITFDKKTTDFINTLTELTYHISKLYITDNNTLIGVAKPLISIPENEYHFPGQKIRYRAQFPDGSSYVSILHYVIDESFIQQNMGKDAFRYACLHPWEKDTSRLLNIIDYNRILQSAYEEILFDDGIYREVNLHFSDDVYRLFYYIGKHNIKGFYVPCLTESPEVDGIYNSGKHFTDLCAKEIEWMKHTAEDLVESFEKNQ